ncbi:hypothetical protein BDV37DRAFT_272560 [Aspergillus pseudonomiae]|uniref:P-loop containing nucleoside triphosphate hydrolase protein n=1 Tax=Aspergillus pseudonomiae TaxID=1506151 RepID=A0A5N7D8R7_9EURO|nr:uncharacterized protein BDV37DRAFT_272560 [Aspergillus pseudonomiae]KAE8402842.1 hypothetical protein BDV37DRAFT_272560 [Aspergillus pseudonomiae]
MERPNGYRRYPYRRTLLVTYPRTASNLLVRMLSLEQQENAISNEKGGYFFWDSFIKGRTTNSTYTPIEDWTTQQTEEMQQVFQDDFNRWESTSRLAESQGKLFFAKEHIQWFADPAAISDHLSHSESHTPSPVNIKIPTSYGTPHEFSPNNLTIFPDHYLETWRLTFLIRHPALAFPSFYRAMRELEKEEFAQPHEMRPLMELNATLRWTRLLYDWCCQHQGEANIGCARDTRYPLVLDAQDIIHHPDILARYCKLIGLNPTYLRSEWDVPNQKVENGTTKKTSHRSPEKVMKSTLENSSHVLKNRTPIIVDIGVERKGWDQEFGIDFGEQMEKWVREAMPDYNYLRARRLQVGDT